MSSKISQDQNLNGKNIVQTSYRHMIRSLLYLTSSRLDIMFSVCLCARFQSNPKACHLTVKIIFRYLHRIKDLGLWYPSNSICFGWIFRCRLRTLQR